MPSSLLASDLGERHGMTTTLSGWCSVSTSIGSLSLIHAVAAQGYTDKWVYPFRNEDDARKNMEG